MKRLIAVLTGLVLLFGVAACAEEAEETPSAPQE